MRAAALNLKRYGGHVSRMKSRKRKIGANLNVILVAGVLIGAIGVGASPVNSEQLKKETAAAFDQYIQQREAGMERELAAGQSFVWIDSLPQLRRSQAYAELKQGQVLIQQNRDCGMPSCPGIPGGLIHDWVGVVFVPGVSLQQAVGTSQDYDHDADYYRPQVMKSKLLSRSDDTLEVFLRLKQVRFITVILDTEYEVRYRYLDAAHAISRSHSTRIAEVENAGEPDEHDRAAGDDRGLLWRLYSYWRFYQADGGIYIQCTAISLTRNIPTGLGWLIRPLVKKVPRESIEFTLDSTRKALVKGSGDTSKEAAK